MHKTQLRTRQT